MRTINVNGADHQLDVDDDTPLLWAIRDAIGLTGTKFGCGIASCGACTVHVDGAAVRSCSLAVSDVEGSAVTTIEALGAGGLHPLQKAWIAEQVPQCGYCQSGMIMAVSSLLATNPNPSDAEIDASINNVCRCGSYPRVRRAIRSIATA